jgi:Tol biopolymer transport system component
MVTGQRAFQGDSKLSTLAAILQQEPRTVSDLRPVPPELERIITRCLRKDINRRGQHIADIALALEELRDDTASGKVAPALTARPGSRSWLWPAIISLLLLLASGLVWDRLRQRREGSDSELVRLTPEDDYAYYQPAISADGKFVVFVSDRGGTFDLWLQRVGSGSPIQLTHSAFGVHWPAFSPDGTQIVYHNDNRQPPGDIYTIPLLGGEPQKVGELGWGPRFSPDGRSIAYRSTQGFMVVSANGGQSRLLPELSGSPFIDAWGNRFPGPVWMDSEHLLTTLAAPASTQQREWDWFVFPVDGGKRIATGLAELFRSNGFTAAVPGFSRGTSLVFTGNKNGQWNLWRVEIEKGSWRASSLRQLTFGTEMMAARSASLDGLAAVEVSRFGSDAYFLPTDSDTGAIIGRAQRLTKDGRLKTEVGIWTPDLYSFQTSNTYVFKQFSSGQETQLVSSTYPVVSAGGREVVVTRGDGDSFSISIHQLDPAAKGADRVICSKCGAPYAITPDGRYLFTDATRRYPDDALRKRSVHIVDSMTGKSHVWLEHPKYSLIASGPVGKPPGGLMILATEPGSKEQRSYFVAWVDPAPPESEWIEVPRSWRATAGSNLYYYFDGNELMANQLDQRGIKPFVVKQRSGSTQMLGPNDEWDLGPRGVIFLRKQIRSSVWLMKMTDR